MREALLGIAVGKKGVGKTYTTLDMITKYMKKHNRRVLVLDVNNEFGNVKEDQNPNFVDIPAISIHDVGRFARHPKIEARRVSVFKDKKDGGGKMSLNEIAEALSIILENFQNGLLLIEDINKFVSDSFSTDLIGAIVTQRHVSVDIITHFQTIGKMGQPKIWGNANWIRFHKCEDTVYRHKQKFGGNIEHLQIAEAMVNREYENGNVHFHCFFDKDKGKIKGSFTRDQFILGCRSFLETEQGAKVLKQEANKIDIDTGKKKYSTHKQALDAVLTRFMKRYYGNPN